MLLKPQMARERLCPIMSARGAHEHCQIDFCLMWRWHFDRVSGVLDGNVKQMAKRGYRIIGSNAGYGGPTHVMVRASGLGFCGLAGEPVFVVPDEDKPTEKK